jgi:hypothetical protein
VRGVLVGLRGWRFFPLRFGLKPRGSGRLFDNSHGFRVAIRLGGASFLSAFGFDGLFRFHALWFRLRRLDLRFRDRDWRIGNIVSVVPAKLDDGFFVDGAGVRLLFGDAKLGEQVQYFVGLDFQLPRQLVNSDLSHR